MRPLHIRCLGGFRDSFGGRITVLVQMAPAGIDEVRQMLTGLTDSRGQARLGVRRVAPSAQQAPGFLGVGTSVSRLGGLNTRGKVARGTALSNWPACIDGLCCKW